MKRHAIVFLILFAALLYAPALLRSLRYDETYTLTHFTASPLIALFDWPVPNNHKLYSFMAWGLRTLQAPDLLALRMPAFFAALVSISLLYTLGQRLGDHRLGLIAAAFLVTNPAFADYAVNGRGYTLMIALSLAFILAEQRRALLWLTVMLVLTLPSCLIICLARPRLPVLIGILVGGLFYVPALAWGQVAAAGQFGSTLPELASELASMFNGTGVVLLCAVGCWGLYYAWPRLQLSR